MQTLGDSHAPFGDAFIGIPVRLCSKRRGRAGVVLSGHRAGLFRGAVQGVAHIRHRHRCSRPRLRTRSGRRGRSRAERSAARGRQSPPACDRRQDAFTNGPRRSRHPRCRNRRTIAGRDDRPAMAAQSRPLCRSDDLIGLFADRARLRAVSDPHGLRGRAREPVLEDGRRRGEEPFGHAVRVRRCGARESRRCHRLSQE